MHNKVIETNENLHIELQNAYYELYKLTRGKKSKKSKKKAQPREEQTPMANQQKLSIE